MAQVLPLFCDDHITDLGQQLQDAVLHGSHTSMMMRMTMFAADDDDEGGV